MIVTAGGWGGKTDGTYHKKKLKAELREQSNRKGMNVHNNNKPYIYIYIYMYTREQEDKMAIKRGASQ